MRKTIKPAMDHEVLSLITDVAFSSVPYWYGATRRNLMMDIIAPKVRTADRKMPLLVWFCGGGYRMVDKSVWLPEMVKYAEAGFVVASPSYRTANESAFPDMLIDGKAAIRYLRAHAEDYCIDPDRVAVMGESGGGTMASLIGTTGGIEEFDRGDFTEMSSAVQAVVDYYGIVDEVHDPYTVTGPDVPPWMLQDFLGIDYTEEMAERASAIHYVSEQTPPFLIFHGSADEAVPVVQSERFYEKLTEKGVDADLYLLEGAIHGEDSFYQKEVTDIILKWLKEKLGIDG